MKNTGSGEMAAGEEHLQLRKRNFVNPPSMNDSNVIQIRNAAPTDVEGVYRMICELENEQLDRQRFQQLYEQNLHNPDVYYWVAATEVKAVGFISFYIQNLLHHCGAVGEVQEFYVDKEFRNKGIGRLLMEEVMKTANARQVKSIEVTSNKIRTANVKVYESLGFKLTHNKFTM